MYICRFFVVSQINNNNCYTLCYSAKYGKIPDIYKQREKFFYFAVASQTFATLSLRRLRVHETTRQRVADAGASLSLRRLRVYKTTRLQVADAGASLSLRRLLVYKTTSGCRLVLRCRFADEVALSYEQ